jgi:hypothetical protein
VAVLAQVILGGSALAADSQNVLAAGRSTLASIDANDNGIPDEEDDCNLSATAIPTGPGSALLNVLGQQDAEESDKLRPCRGSCEGSGFMSSEFGEVTLNTCDYAGPPFVPLLADFCSTLESCTSEMATSGASGQTAGFDGDEPVVLRAGAIFRIVSGAAGFGQLCIAGGPAAEVTGDDGVTVLRQLFAYPPGSSDPTHMCLDNLPVQMGESSEFEMKTACFPVANGVVPLALSGNPEAPFAIIDFGRLLPCGAVRGAPTVNEWGLIGLAAGLLGLGVWALGRRREFAGMPLP